MDIDAEFRETEFRTILMKMLFPILDPDKDQECNQNAWQMKFL